MTIGKRPNKSAIDRQDAMVLILEERKTVKLITASMLNSPQMTLKHCSCPIVIFGRLIMEYSICMEVLVHSHPQRLLDTRTYIPAQSR